MDSKMIPEYTFYSKSKMSHHIGAVDLVPPVEDQSVIQTQSLYYHEQQRIFNDDPSGKLCTIEYSQWGMIFKREIFHDNGHIWVQNMLRNQMCYGICSEWAPDGTLISQIEYKDGWPVNILRAYMSEIYRSIYVYIYKNTLPKTMW